MKSQDYMIANLEILRKDRGFTIAVLAAKAGIAGRTLDNIIARKHYPSLRTITVLAETLGVEPWEMLRPPVK